MASIDNTFYSNLYKMKQSETKVSNYKTKTTFVILLALHKIIYKTFDTKQHEFYEIQNVRKC